MADQESIDKKKTLKRVSPLLEARTYVRTASLANLLVATLFLVQFSAIAIHNQDGSCFGFALLLVSITTLAIWCTAAVFFFFALAPRWLLLLGRSMVVTLRPSMSGRSGVWDRWLDSPEPLGP